MSVVCTVFGFAPVLSGGFSPGPRAVPRFAWRGPAVRV